MDLKTLKNHISPHKNALNIEGIFCKIDFNFVTLSAVQMLQI